MRTSMLGVTISQALPRLQYFPFDSPGGGGRDGLVLEVVGFWGSSGRVELTKLKFCGYSFRVPRRVEGGAQVGEQVVALLDPNR